MKKLFICTFLFVFTSCLFYSQNKLCKESGEVEWDLYRTLMKRANMVDRNRVNQMYLKYGNVFFWQRDERIGKGRPRFGLIMSYTPEGIVGWKWSKSDGAHEFRINADVSDVLALMKQPVPDDDYFSVYPTTLDGLNEFIGFKLNLNGKEIRDAGIISLYDPWWPSAPEFIIPLTNRLIIDARSIVGIN